MNKATPELLAIMAKAASFGESGFSSSDIDLDFRTDAFKAAFGEAVSSGLIVPMCSLRTNGRNGSETGKLMISPHLTLAAA